jgi:DNA mismatch repair ATPase MutS
LFSAELGKGNKGCRFTLHHPPLSRGGTWFTQIIAGLRKHILGKNSVARRKGTPTFSFSLNPRDESGSRALAELRNRGIGIAAGTIAKSTMHVQSFLSALQTELAFYIGCMNLSDQLGKKGGRFCFPLPAPLAEKHLAFKGIYDICLALQSASTVVGNDADADDRDMIVVTGANQGGKSTLLRSIGLAQLMMQCGMFVSADTFCSNVCKGLFTHFKREEDTSMTSGKLDEELSRVSEIIYHATSSSMILFNESFAATNEREGSEIARQIISALLERSVKVICVTHLYELAQGFFETNTGNILFLRAQRNEEGERTFKLVEGQPLRTSFGEDLYEKIFYE